ncbi:MAG: transcriptional repressor [Pirellulales bacterium]|nr:transcriptional repressor [Pirellulales bacterium]
MTDRPQERETRQRQVVLEELRKVSCHPTAPELYELVRKRLPKISLGTVYRNLERLSQRGTIRKLVLGGTETRFDGDLDVHDHVRCAECGRVDDVENLPKKIPDPAPDMAAGYTILGHRLEYFGLCPSCQQKRRKKRGKEERGDGKEH